jgi:hypothetical protein
MSEQKSQKRGVRSEAQKEDEARDAYAPIPAASRVAGAFGDRQNESISDEELALTQEQKRIREQNG